MSPLGRYVVTAGSTSSPTTLLRSGSNGSHVRFVSLTAVGADVRYDWGESATANSFYLKNGETVYMDVPWHELYQGDDPVLHGIRNASTDGTIEVISWGSKWDG